MCKQKSQAEVLIVGAGPAGLMVASELAKKDISTTIVESGGNQSVDDMKLLNTVINSKSEFKAAIEGRYRGLGGTSQIWGGALIPLKDEDCNPHHLMWHGGWPVNMKEMRKYYNKVYSFFGADNCRVKDTFEYLDFGFILRQCRWPKFKNRNAFHSFSKINHKNMPKIMVNLTLVGIKRKGQDYIAILKRMDGSISEIQCKRIIICCGAIESTRQALLVSHLSNTKSEEAYSTPGHFLQDHISVITGKITGHNVNKFFSDFNFKLVKSGLKSSRLEMSNKHHIFSKSPAGFVHFSRSSNDSSAFVSLKKIMQSFQRKQMPKLKEIYTCVKDPAFMIKFIFFYLMKKEVYRGKIKELDVNYVFEQEPDYENSITLSDTCIDSLGVPMVKIRWSLTENDKRNLSIGSKALEQSISQLAEEYGCQYTPSDKLIMDEGVNNNIQVYHPVGTLSFSSIKDKSKVINSRLELPGVPNIHFLSTAIFPSSSGANPTFSLLIIACHLVSILYPNIKN